MASVSLFHATIYAFTQEGVREITKLFDIEIVDVNVRCSYNRETHMFRIQCPIDVVDTTYSNFAALCNSYIKQHCEDEPNTKFTRMRETQVNADMDLDFEMLMAEEGDEPLDQFSTPQDDLDDEDSPIWRPKDVRTDVTKVFPERVLDSITTDVACALTLSVERACVVIQEASNDAVQLLCQRLDNIERNKYRTMATAHFVRPEKERDVHIVLRTLLEVPDDMLLRTLTPRELAYRLPRMRRVRMMRLNREIVSTPAPVSMTNQNLLAAWNSLVHPQLNGFESEAHHYEFAEANKPIGQQSISLWAHNVVPDPLEDDTPLEGFEPLIPEVALSLARVSHEPDLGFPESYDNSNDLMDGGQEQPQEPGEISVPKEQGLLKTHNHGLLIPGLEEPEAAIPELDIPTPEPDAFASESEGRGEDAGKVRLPWENIYATGTTTVGNLLDPPEASSAPALAPQRADSRSRPTRSGRVIDVNPIAQHAARFQTPYTRSPSPGNLTTRNPQPRKVPSAPLRPSAKDIQGRRTAATTTSADQTPEPSNGRQVPPSSPSNASNEETEDDIIERVQADSDSEIASRKFNPSTYHRKGKGKGKDPISVAASNLELPEWLPARLTSSNRQNSGRPSPKPMESQPQNPKALELPEFSKDLMRILDQARSFHGKIETEVQIGRILLSGFRVDQAKAFTTSVVDPEQMASGLQRYSDAGDVQDYFTRRLTTSVSEACLVPVPHLFDQEPLTSTSWYEFHCEDSQHNCIIVKVSGDDFDVEAVQFSETVGQVLLHFPKRKWDARVVVKAQKQYPIENIEKEIVHLVDSVSAVLRESTGDSLEELHKIIDMRFRNTKKLRVTEVFAKRRMTHECRTNQRITLCVTEIQHLSINGLIHHLQDTALWGATSSTRAYMIENHALWFEAKLMISAHPFLEQNLDLHFGDDAGWMPDEVMDGELLCDVQAVVDQMVTRLDGVGMTNKGIRGSREDLAEIEAERKRREMEKTVKIKR